MEPGFVDVAFAPADHVLTDVYLGGELAGRPVVSTFIHHADVYSAMPDELVSGRKHVRDRDGNDACYIISSVRYAGKNKNGKQRTIDGDPRKSKWHSEDGKIPLEGSESGGYVQDFTLAFKDGRMERLGWRMKEYGLWTEEHGDSDLVLCKIYRTPRKPSTTTTPAVRCSKKRKAADGDHQEEGSMPASVRPRLTDDHPPMADPAPTLEPESADDELYNMYCQVMDDDKIKAAMPNAPDLMEDLDGYLASFEELMKNIVAESVQEIDASSHQRKAAQPEPEPASDVAAAPPSSFFQGIEEEFMSLYANHNNVTMTEEAALPWAQAAQPEENDAATGPLKTIITADDQMDASLSEEEGAHPEPEPDHPAPDEVIYGLPCPPFSPEMISRCSDDLMTPWPSPSSMQMIFDLY